MDSMCQKFNFRIEKKKLWEICNFDRRFIGVDKNKQKVITNFKHVSAKNLKNYELYDSEEVKILSTGNYEGYTKLDEKDKNINFGEVITLPTGGTANIKYHKGYFLDSGNILLTSSIVNLKYVYYYLKNINDSIQLFYRGAGVQHPSMRDIIEIEIPLPPKEVQNEIVQVLDEFTELEAELKAELEARKKQYDYYQNELLNFENVEFVDIGSIAMLVRGASPRPISKYITDSINDGIPWIKISDTKVGAKYLEETKEKITLEGSLKSRIVQPGDLILSNSMSYGRTYISKITGCIHDGWILISNFEEHYTTDFLYYLLNSKFVIDRFDSMVNSSSVKNLNIDIVNRVKIPVVSLEKQKQIVSILDKFSTLVNDIKEGLPAEIELRRKQYEYYRDKLLTFDTEE
jgi:type I restriction enzyme S subunit